MLNCIPRSKQSAGESEKSNSNAASQSKQSAKNLSSQIKDMALKASGAYKNCNSCTSQPNLRRNGSVSGGAADLAAPDKFRWSYRRTGSFSSNSTSGRKELEARLKGISSGEVTPTSISASASGRRADPVVFVEENEPKEWVAQVEPGVLITFVSLPRGGNDLKRIRFSREMFNKNQAQKWWTDNYDKVMELYNVKKLNRQAFPLPTPPRTQDQILKMEHEGDALNKERVPRSLYRPNHSSSESLEQQHSSHCYDMAASTPKLSSISGLTKTETSSITTTTTSTSRDADRSEFSISNASDLESEWVEQDEPGVYITIRALPNGRRELRRVRFSREKFGEMHARVWWEENRARIHKQYL
ncbi:unnamed protein product [Cuscuta campestris]|uniref:BRX domain-containing protein n=1 Tax=Cuscuta campestris TaxID=132261 RepID=A0A484N9D0_9ASTE|nr:unnamed protein product [Cuscuta campestris]